MSTSFFGKLKDKVNFKLNEAVDDPEARKFADEEKKAKEKEIKENATSPIKEVEKTKEELEQQKVLDFLKENEKVIEAKLIPMIDSYAKRLEEKGAMRPVIDREKNRIFAEVLKVAAATLSMDEILWTIEDLIDKTENPKKGIQPKNILKGVWRNIKRIVKVAFVPFVSLIMASLISNEMIVYPAPIRFAFFFFTFILCIISQMILVLLVMFYLCKWGYHYYVNEMSDGPKRIIMPSLFAILPLTTKEYSNRLLNLLARPFQYGEKWSKKDGEELKERMEIYNSSLKASFPFIETIKTREPYADRLTKIEMNLEKLHRYIPPVPVSNSKSPPPINNTNKKNSISEPPLPPVIQPLPPIYEPVTEPVAEPVIEPVVEPVVEPVTEPVVEPVTEPVVEPVAEPVTEPVVEPVVEPVTEPVAEPVTGSVTEPVVEPVVKPVTEPVTEPVVEPVAVSSTTNSTQIPPPPAPIMT